ncbi:DUF2272 domain-containing protein [Chitinibacter sp. S2-10]|uniref:DUF2272 domain-containing protein n=1 Tax=Chitinibacter sp. S2-10 TaxID=3373597 RepID=UPI0039774914
MKPILMVLLLALSACRSLPEPAEPQISVPIEESPEPVVDEVKLPHIGSAKYKIIEQLQAEWVYFGQQTVVIDGDQESIPQVGIWEDDDRWHGERINQYWRAVGMPRLSGFDCREPWSAAFISWIMQQSHIPKGHFLPSAAHRTYLNQMLANKLDPATPWIPHHISEYQPEIGDLICATRSKTTPPAGVLPDTLKLALHCDIVVSKQSQVLHVIGGNVRNSVSKTILTLSPQGYLQASSQRPWFLIVENRLD